MEKRRERSSAEFLEEELHSRRLSERLNVTVIQIIDFVMGCVVSHALNGIQLNKNQQLAFLFICPLTTDIENYLFGLYSNFLFFPKTIYPPLNGIQSNKNQQLAFLFICPSTTDIENDLFWPI